MRKLLSITSGRHPFQVGVLAGVTLAAAGVLLSATRPRSLAATLPEPLLYSWMGLLIGGGLAAQAGAFWPGDLDTGLIIEGAGVLAVATMTSLYVVTLAWVQGSASIAAAGFIGGIAAACWWRVGQIILDVRKLWCAQRHGVTREVQALVEHYTHGPFVPNTAPEEQ